MPIHLAPRKAEMRDWIQADAQAQSRRFANLMNAMTGTVEPDSWEDLSGPGSVYPVEASSCLVIRRRGPCIERSCNCCAICGPPSG